MIEFDKRYLKFFRCLVSRHLMLKLRREGKDFYLPPLDILYICGHTDMPTLEVEQLLARAMTDGFVIAEGVDLTEPVDLVTDNYIIDEALIEETLATHPAFEKERLNKLRASSRTVEYAVRFITALTAFGLVKWLFL